MRKSIEQLRIEKEQEMEALFLSRSGSKIRPGKLTEEKKKRTAIMPPEAKDSGMRTALDDKGTTGE